MKKIILIFATLFYTLFSNAQLSYPSEFNEYCPKQEYNFSVDIYATGNSTASYTTSGGVQIVGTPYIHGSRYYYKVKFADYPGTQIVKITYNGNPFEVKYKYIKSLFGGYSHPNDPNQIEVPLCNTNPFTLQLNGKFTNQYTNPVSYFGTIIKYSFKLPAGWKINNQLSTGSNWITINGPVFNITPDASTTGVIWYIAKNDCPDLSLFDAGAASVIYINRPNPTFTLSPSSLTFVCGTQQTKTFTVSTPNSISCSTSYLWSLGANNGWLYNGSPAPASFSTTTSSITLTSANGNILPSTVNVTPILNGTSYAQMSCTTAFTAFSSSATITGNTAICPSNSVVCTINNLGAGNTVTWSSSSTAVATVSGGTQSQVTVNGVANGFADIIATISNACGQTVIKKNTVYVGVPTTPAAGIYANPMWVRNNFFPLTIDFPVIPNATSYVWTIENDPENPPYCTTATSYPAKFVLNNSNTTLATTTPSAKINFGGCFGTYFIKCKAINNCGETDVFYKHIWVGSSGSSPCDKNNNISSEFKILQNPIKNGVLKLKTDILFNNDIITEDASILQGDGPCEGPWEAPIIGKISSQNLNTVIAIYDMAGVKRLEKQIDNNKESIEITNFNLPSGNYILHFKKGNQISKKIIIIE